MFSELRKRPHQQDQMAVWPASGPHVLTASSFVAFPSLSVFTDDNVFFKMLNCSCVNISHMLKHLFS